MGSLIGQGIEYDVRGGGGKGKKLRGQQQIPSKNRPKYPYCPFEPPPRNALNYMYRSGLTEAMCFLSCYC